MDCEEFKGQIPIKNPVVIAMIDQLDRALGAAGWARHYKSNSVHRCHAKGPTGARPYAFTVNQEHVLFYVCHEDARLTQAQLADFDVRPAPARNPRWQLVKLYTVNDVLRLGRHFK